MYVIYLACQYTGIFHSIIGPFDSKTLAVSFLEGLQAEQYRNNIWILEEAPLLDRLGVVVGVSLKASITLMETGEEFTENLLLWREKHHKL